MTRALRACLAALLAGSAGVAVSMPAAVGVEVGTNDFAISSQAVPGGIADTAIAYNSTTDQYLVVWEGVESASGSEAKAAVYGQLVDARTGAQVGSNDVVIASMAGSARTDAVRPSVVYNSARNEFVVAFVGDATDEGTASTIITDTFEAYAVRVSAGGSAIGAPLRVSSMGTDDANGSYDVTLGAPPGLSYNASNDTYLVVWSGDDNADGLVNGETEVFAQVVGHSGSALAEVGADDIQVSSMAGANGTGAFDARDPAVAFSSATGGFLATWQADDNTAGAVDNRFNIYAQALSGAGAPSGARQQVNTVGTAADTTVETFSPEVVRNSVDDQWLVVWEGDGANSTGGAVNDFEIWGQRLNGVTLSPVGSNTQLSQMGPTGSGLFTAQAAMAAYNPSANEYFLTWRGETNTAGLVDDEVEIFGARLTAGLGTVEAQHRVSDLGPNGQPNLAPQAPFVAYSERSVNGYLLTWAGENPGVTAAGESEVWGQLEAGQANLSISKSRTPANPQAGGVLTWTLTYTNSGPDTVYDVVVTDLLPAGLSSPSFTSTGPTPVARPGAPYTWDIASLTSGASGSITITTTVSGTLAEASVLANTATIGTGTISLDPALANNTASASATVDNPPSLVSIDRAASSPTNASTVAWTVTFDQGVSGVDALDFGLTAGAGLSGTSITGVTGTGATRTVTASTGSGEGSLTLGMSAPVGIVDTAVVGGKALTTANLPFVGQVYQVDTTAPTLTLTSTTADPTKVSPIPVTAQFSEAVAGFTAADIGVVNATVGSVIVIDADTVTFSLTPTAQGLVTATVASGSLTDLAGNALTVGAQITREFDDVRPTLTLTTTATDPTATSPIPVTATFSEAVTGFDASDVTVTGGSVATVSGSGAVYTFSVTPTAQGLVEVDVAADAALDATGNGNTAAATLERTFDSAGPGVTLSADPADPTSVSPISVTVQFTEEVVGFDAADIVIGNATLAGFTTVDADTFTVDLAPSAEGLVTMDVAAAVATDLAGNANLAATQLSRTFDSLAPTVTVEKQAGQADPTSTSPIRFTVTFSEPVIGFDVSAVDLTGPAGSTALVTGTGPTYTVQVSGMSADGVVTVSVPAGAVTDAAGLTNSASVSIDNSVRYDEPDRSDIAVGVVSPASVAAGAQVTFEVEVSNAGPDPATSVRTTATLPVGLTAVRWESSSGSCDASGCDLGEIAVGSSRTATLVASTAADGVGDVLLTDLSATTITLDGDLTNNTASVSTTLVESADLIVTSSVIPANPVPGDRVTIRTSLTNAGPSVAREVELVDLIDPAMTDVSTTVDLTPGAPLAGREAVSPPCVIDSGNVLTCALGDLAPADAVTVSITGNLAPDAGSVTNSVTVSSPTPDPADEDNTSTFEADVSPSADVEVTKVADPASAEPGDPVGFELSISNAGPSTAADVVLRDDLPAGLRLVGAPTTDVGTCAVSGDTITCELGDLPPGTGADVLVETTLDSSVTSDEVTNTAEVTSGTPDPDESNNLAQATVAVGSGPTPTPPPTDPVGPSDPDLPQTGTDSRVGWAFGLLAVATGVLLVLLPVARRRDY